MPSIVKLTLESNQYERNIKNAQKQLNDFTKSIGINMKSLSGMALAAGAVTGALKVAKDAFFKNEQQLDEWGRTVEASKSLYNGFLNALNNGDIGGFLSNINSITEAARAAYNALDDLSTFNAFNQVNVEKSRTGMTEAIAGFRTGETSKESVKAAADSYKKELQQRQEMEREAYSQAIRKIAAERGVPWGNLEQALSGSYGSYKELKETMPTGKRIVYQSAGQFGGTLSYEVPMAVTAQEKMGEALRALNDTELQNLQALGAQAERTGNEIASIDKQVARILNGRGGAGGSTSKGGSGRTANEISYASDSIMAQEKLVVELTQKWKTAGAAVRDNYKAQLDAAQNKLKEMTSPMGPQMKLWQGDIDDLAGGAGIRPMFSDSIVKSIDEISNYFLQNPIIIPIETTEKDVKAIAQSASITADIVGSIGDAFNAIEDPAAKVMGTVMQAIASVALGYAQATVQASELGPWAWIAFAASGLATMMATISSIHSATGYAQGGEVQGNSYSGDNIPIMANAGEVVLTKAMTRTLAANLQGNGMGNMNLRTKVKGTELLVWLDNSLAQSGRGELVTWGQ